MDVSKSHLVYRFQGFVLEVRNRRLTDSSGHDIKLSSRAFDALVELLHHQGQILGKDYLMETVWQGLVVEENNLNQAISLVRKALGGSTGESVFIKTVSGKGFCFVADVQIEGLADPLTQPTGSAAEPLIASATLASKKGAAFLWNAYLQSGVAVVALILLLVVIVVNYLDTNTVAGPNAVDLARPATVSSARVENPGSIPDSIAVIPFVNLGQDSGSDLFVLGLHDELINQLTKIRNLKVISRDSVISVAEKGGSVFEMADLLNVESVMTGSILVVDDHARINLQMQNADTAVVLWGESFEVDTRNLSEMISAQAEIAMKVVTALEVEVKPPESASMAALPTKSFEAYRYFLTARNSHNHQANEEKWDLFRKALELDPDYAEAHLLFASINSLLMTGPMEGFTYEDHQQLMLQSVEAFIRLEPGRSEGYALKAVALGTGRDWNGVAEQLAVLNQLGVSGAEKKYVALLLMSLGDFQGAASIYQESLLTEPANLYSRGLLMAAHEMAGNRELARQEYALGNELKTVWWGNTVNVLLALGRNEPINATDNLADLSPELIQVLDNFQDHELVNQGIERYLAGSGINSRDDVFYSALAAHHGDMESANALLRIAMEKVSTSIFWAWLPVFDEVRRTGEFRQMLVDFGLVAYWQQHGWPEVCQPHADTFSCDWVAYPN